MNKSRLVLVSTEIGAGFIEDNVVRRRLFWGPPTDFNWTHPQRSARLSGRGFDATHPH